MRKFFVVLALVMVSGTAWAHEPHKPTAEFWARFAPLPEGARDPSPWFVEFGARVVIQQADLSAPLDGYAVGTGLCERTEPCEFRLSVILLLEKRDDRMVPVGLRYLLDKADGTSVQGYAQQSTADGAPSYYRRSGNAWALLQGPQAVTEEVFVAATSSYVATQ